MSRGESFEIEKDFTGLALKKGEKAVFMDVVSEDGQGFFADRPGTYLATYLVEVFKSSHEEAYTIEYEIKSGFSDKEQAEQSYFSLMRSFKKI